MLLERNENSHSDSSTMLATITFNTKLELFRAQPSIVKPTCKTKDFHTGTWMSNLTSILERTW